MSVSWNKLYCNNIGFVIIQCHLPDVTKQIEIEYKLHNTNSKIWENLQEFQW